MAKEVILILELNIGDYSDAEEDWGEIPTDPEFWEESLIQGDWTNDELKIVGVRLEDAQK
jgi:hypothetical protein